MRGIRLWAFLFLGLGLLASDSHARWDPINCTGSRLIMTEPVPELRCFHGKGGGDTPFGQFNYYELTADTGDLFFSVNLTIAGLRSYVYLHKKQDFKDVLKRSYAIYAPDTHDWGEVNYIQGLYYIEMRYKTWPCYGFQRGDTPYSRGYRYSYMGVVCWFDRKDLDFRDAQTLISRFKRR